jgi:DNA-directed RNA polymerase subunit RPC12/RpoP
MKKMTRKEKEALSKQGICWKCGSKIVAVGGVVRCENCGLKVVKY